MRKSIYALLALLMLVAAACGDSGTTSQSPTPSIPATDDPSPTEEPTETEEPCVDQTDQDLIEIEMGELFFDPECLIVNASQPISVENTGEILHNFQIPGTQVDVDVEPGKTFNGEGNFVEPGEYSIRCKYHSSMLGTITVN